MGRAGTQSPAHSCLWRPRPGARATGPRSHRGELARGLEDLPVELQHAELRRHPLRARRPRLFERGVFASQARRSRSEGARGAARGRFPLRSVVRLCCRLSLCARHCQRQLRTRISKRPTNSPCAHTQVQRCHSADRTPSSPAVVICVELGPREALRPPRRHNICSQSRGCARQELSQPRRCRTGDGSGSCSGAAAALALSRRPATSWPYNPWNSESSAPQPWAAAQAASSTPMRQAVLPLWLLPLGASQTNWERPWPQPGRTRASTPAARPPGHLLCLLISHDTAAAG